MTENIFGSLSWKTVSFFEKKYAVCPDVLTTVELQDMLGGLCSKTFLGLLWRKEIFSFRFSIVLTAPGELRPGPPGHSPCKLKPVRLPVRKMTSTASENPPAQAGQGFRDFKNPGSSVPEVRLAAADAAKIASDFHRKTAKPQINQGLGGGAGSRSRTGTPSLAADFE